MATKQKKATSQSNKAEQLHWGFWFGVGFFVLVILSLCYMGWLMSERLSAQESTPVTSVEIMGEMPYTTRLDIEKAIETINLGNFFNVDVNKVQQHVADLPWVYSVSVRKQWPNELKIYVVDQKPVAFWNGDFLINTQGVAFQADTSRVVKHLPAFYGPEGSEQTALENYTNLSEILAFGELGIDELMLSERYSWQLTLNDGVSLNLGRENRVQRIQRFIDVYPQIKKNAEQKQQVDYVDLRYDTGLSVGWKPLTEKERV
ncbi:cell division protein FtsQ/DivIB [Thalassotalea sp. 1_MG-2023]|uniref:cell division protein FtsQ/DivIB n=1 Tax=Thalassotalea sp. 1_MG-2023 TaxID=3062680 RepID=UPI0026E1C034|nr:cell division protein FtsQ/DivIB [Thalassotalea sp. 1_MG-2023]MDO6427185.1 cell division protein FtsQ/DivIB [Thalassotalea sp. 1_MG-2023]